MSRLVFRAKMHDEGIRGDLIRQRRQSKDDKWEDGRRQDIRTIDKNHGFSIELDTETFNNLIDVEKRLKLIMEQNGIQPGVRRYKIVDLDGLVISDSNQKLIFKKILEADRGEDFWQQLAEDEPNLANKLSILQRQQVKKQVIQEFEQRLNNPLHSETSGDNSWQKWLFRNNWLFGVKYQEPIEKAKINIQGSMPDYLFPTLDGFIDILDIKLPQSEVVIQDHNHRGAWKWSSEANEAIGQAVNYLDEIQRNRLEIEKLLKIDAVILKPRACIVIGDCENWSLEQREGFRKLNASMNDVAFLTYRNLLNRAERLVF